LIHTRPNDWMTPSELKSMIMNHLALRGNFYAYTPKSGPSGRVREILPFAPNMMEEVTQNKDWSLNYRIKFPDGDTRNLPARNILHIKGMVSNGYLGVNPIQQIRESIGLGLAAEEFGARYFGSGTHPSMIVEHPGKIGDVAAKNLRDSLSEEHSGLGKSHRLMLLEEGMKAQKVSIDPKDAQFLELRQYQRSEIVDIFFATPLSLMQKSDGNATYASAEQFSIGFVVYSLVPWLVSIEEAFNRDILTAEDKPRYYKFVTQGLLRGSFKDQMAGFATAIDKEIFNPNECRELLEYNPYDGGDEYRTRTSTVRQEAGEDKE
jgi:HK97 family phage portal protein